MPTVRSQTGDPGWDQTLSTLGELIAGDPSKAASAYYYGTKSRESLLQSQRLIDQQHDRNRYRQMTQGQPALAPPTYQQPSLPGSAPIQAAPANLPMAGAPGALAATVSNMTPQQAADMIPAAVAPMTTGTPPPYSPPSAVSPPAPNTTTSNGQVPQNDPVSGVLHPASINTSGVPVQASPAAANGAPAQVPPGMTLPNLMALHGTGALAGIDAATLAGGGQALAFEMRSRNLITDNQYNQMLAGTGQAGPYQQDIQARSALAVGAQTQAGETARNAATNAAAMARQQVVTGQARYEFDTTAKPTIDEAGVTRYTPQPQLAGKQYYDPSVASTVAGERQRQEGAVGTYMDPNNPGKTIRVKEVDAIARGLQPAPKSVEEAQAPISTAIFGTQTPEAAGPLIERRDRAVPPPRKPEIEKAKDEVAQQWMLNRQLGATIPPAPVTGFFGGVSSDQKTAIPGGAGPALGPILNKLANDYYRSGPPGVKGEWTAASNAAIQQGIEEGWIRPDQPKTTPIILPTGEDSVPTQHFQIDLYDPADKTKPINQAKPLSVGSRFTPTMKGATLGAAVTTPAPGAPATTAAPAPTGGRKVGRAPAGTPDGPYTLPGGEVVDVRGGIAYAR